MNIVVLVTHGHTNVKLVDFLTFVLFVLKSTHKGLSVRVIASFGSVAVDDDSCPNLKEPKFGHRLPTELLLDIGVGLALSSEH